MNNAIAKYRYMIFTPYEGAHLGTNSQGTAFGYAKNEEFFVVDVFTGETIDPDGERRPVTNLDEAGRR